jgi:hypothetical protein
VKRLHAMPDGPRRPCRVSRRTRRHHDQDASDPAFLAIVQPETTNEQAIVQAKVLAWGRYANRVWPIRKS